MSGFFKKNPSTRGRKTLLRDVLAAQNNIPQALKAAQKEPADKRKLSALPVGPFRATLQQYLTALDPVHVDPWIDVILHANALNDGAKPTASWLRKGADLTSQLPAKAITSASLTWLSDFRPDPKKPDGALAVLTGLLWLAAPTQPLINALNQYAMHCFCKVPGIGPRALKTGNACLAILSHMAKAGHDLAAAELIVIRGKTRYPVVRKSVNAALTRVAAHRCIDLKDLEATCLPDFGLNAHGVSETVLGGYRARIAVTATGVNTSWFSPEGKTLKRAPAALRRHHKNSLDTLRGLQNSLADLLSAESQTLEASYLDQRKWSFADWKTRYCLHPVRRSLIESLIWVVEKHGAPYTFTPQNGTLINATGDTVAEPPAVSSVSLWHPVSAEPQERARWKARQSNPPFAQSTRRVFDAQMMDPATPNYTNHFAAHILYDKQFAAICQKMDWRYNYVPLGRKSATQAVRVLPQWHLQAQLTLQPVVAPDAAEGGVTIGTNRLSFTDEHRAPVALRDVPTVCFSEVLCEVDKLVIIASRADNSAWDDPDRAHPRP